LGGHQCFGQARLCASQLLLLLLLFVAAAVGEIFISSPVLNLFNFRRIYLQIEEESSDISIR
jgi:hypothetical protein